MKRMFLIKTNLYLFQNYTKENKRYKDMDLLLMHCLDITMCVTVDTAEARPDVCYQPPPPAHQPAPAAVPMAPAENQS